MGPLFDVLTLPVMGPIRGVAWIAEKILEQAENELYNPAKVRQKLEELELEFDLGKITEEEYLEAENELLNQLKVIRERNTNTQAT